MDPKSEILTAVKAGDVARVKELLQQERSLAGAADENDVSALLLAAYYQKPEVVALLLRSGIELNLFEAAATGQTDRVKALVKKSPESVNAYAADGFTPLSLAAFFDHMETVEVLLAAGAAVNVAARNAHEVTPLHAAAAANHTDVARLLVARGADVNACQQAGFTPLHAAASEGNLDLAGLLLDRGAKVNARNEDGETPMALAIKHKREEMVTLLRARAGTE